MAEIKLADLVEPTVIDNQKVYILTDGTYSDYHIVAVFHTQEEAETFAAMHQRDFECPEIEEWAISTVENVNRPVMTYWEIRIYEDGTVRDRESSYTFDVPSTVTSIETGTRNPLYLVKFSVPKGTVIEQVDKIARDRLAKYRYERLEQEMIALKQQMIKE